MPRGVRYLVTGTGRSGTGYTAHLLRHLGFKCGHEHVWSLHRPPPKPGEWDGDASWIAAAYLPLPVVVLHQIRHPLSVVNSLCGDPAYMRGDPAAHAHEWWRFQAEHCGSLVAGDPPALNALRWWRDWNLRIEPWAALRWRLEDLDVPTVRAITALLGVEASPRKINKALDTAPAGYNRHQRAALRWGDLPNWPEKTAAAELANRYGYEVT